MITDILGRLGEVPGDVWLTWLVMAGGIAMLVRYGNRPAPPDLDSLRPQTNWNRLGCLFPAVAVLGFLLMWSVLAYIAPELLALLSGG